MVCAITSPSAGATVSQGTPVQITGTISQAGTVVVKLGAAVLGAATIAGLNWSFSWTPQVGDIGSATINAVGTATVTGSVDTAPGVTVTVAAASDPTNLAGSANLSLWLRADKGITLGVTMVKASNLSGGVVTLGGTLAQATPAYVIVMVTGNETTCKVALSVTGGTTFLTNPADGTLLFTPAQAATAFAAVALTLSFGAGTYNLGTYYNATVASWTDQKGGFVFANATASQQPVLNYARAGGQLSVKWDATRSTNLKCSTAGVAAAWAATNPAFSLYVGMRSGSAATAVGGIIGVGITGNAAAFWHLYNATNTWETFSGNGSAAGTITADTRYMVEYFHTGTAESLIASGVTVKNATAQSLNLTSAIDTVVLGATAINGAAGNFGDAYIDEYVVYNANNHATTAPALPNYLNARYVDLISTAIPDASFSDHMARTVAVVPPTDVPNDYRQSIGLFDRLKYTVPPGVTGVAVTAVPSFDSQSTAIPLNKVLVWLDGVKQTPLTYSGVLGLAATQTFALNGSAHTIELECEASIVGVSGVGGSLTLVAPAAPNTRYFAVGDSITRGYLATDWNGWSDQVRHALSSATYGTTIWGVIGQTLFNYANTSGVANTTAATIAALLDGTAKNIVDISLSTNDWGAGVTAANILTYFQNIVAAIHTASPSAKIILSTPILRTGEATPNAGGATLANYRTQIASVVTANNTFCTLFDGSVYSPGGDGIHPADSTYAQMAVDKKALILTL
jgi:lysophospholipase L1-like esterase